MSIACAYIVFHLLAESEDVKRFVGKLHVLPVIDGGHGELSLRDKPIVENVIAEMALLFQILDFIRHDVIKRMVAALQRLLVGETGLLEQVDDHVGSGQLTGGVEVDTDELSEPGRVVVPHGLGVAPSLKDRVGLDDLVLKGGLAFLPLSGGADGGKVRDDLLGFLRLSGSRLSCCDLDLDSFRVKELWLIDDFRMTWCLTSLCTGC